MPYEYIGDGPYGLRKIEWQTDSDAPGPRYIDLVRTRDDEDEERYVSIVVVRIEGMPYATALDAYLDKRHQHEIEEASQFMLDLANARKNGNV